MAQFLQTGPVPNRDLGEEVGASFGSGLNKGLEALMKQKVEQMQQRRQAKAYEPFLGAERSQALAAAPPALQKSVLELLSMPERFAYESGIQEQKTGAATAAQQAKSQEERAAQLQKYEGFNDSLNRMEELIPSTGQMGLISTFGGPLNRGLVERREEFDTLAQQMESIFRDLVSKGQFPVASFNKIQEILPNSRNSERVNRGRIKAIRRILDSSMRPTGQERDSEMRTGLGKVEPGTPLTTEAMAKISDAAKNDPQKALRIARQLGYAT